MKTFQCAIAADLVRRVQMAVSTEETRYYLNGFHVEPCPEGGALIVATDGHKMLMFRDPDGIVTGTGIVRLDAATLKALKPGRGEAKDRLLIVDGQRAAVATAQPREDCPALIAAPNATVMAFQPHGALIDGTFPDWRRVLPTGKQHPTTATFNAAFVLELAKALKPDGHKDAHATLIATGRDADDAAKSPHMMFAPAPLQGFAVIMPCRDKQERATAAPSWVAAPAAKSTRKAA